MVPAHQGLGALHDAGGQLDLGLEADIEPVALQRLPQVGRQREAPRGGRVVDRVVQLPAAAVALGGVGRDVGRWISEGVSMAISG